MVGDRDAAGDPIDYHEPGDPRVNHIEFAGQERLFSGDTPETRGLLMDVGTPRESTSEENIPKDSRGQGHLFAPMHTQGILGSNSQSNRAPYGDIGDRPLTGEHYATE